MAKMLDCLLSNLFLFSAVSLIIVHDGVAHMPVPNFDIESCESVCVTAFTDSKASNQKICQRGCRLMSMISLMGYPSCNSDSHRDSCYKSCKEAYTDTDSEAACAFGCQSQLPATENQRKQLSGYYGGRSCHNAIQGSPLTNVHGYGRRVMDCLADFVNHQVRFGWMVYRPVGAGGGQDVAAASGRITVVLSDSGSDVAGMVDDVPGDWDSPERKTASYVETNLAAVDRAATPNIKSSQVDSVFVVDGNGFHDDRLSAETGGSGGSRSHDDWLFCLEKRTGTSKKIMMLILVLSLLVIIYICATSMTGSTATAKKTSVYGDLECLTELDDKEFLLKLKVNPYGDKLPSAQAAPPLPIKMPVQFV